MRLPSESDDRVIVLQRFERGEPAGLPVEAIRPLFPVMESESEPCNWIVRYDDGISCQIGLIPLDTDPATAGSLEIQCPCEEIRLWDALFSILGSGAVVLYLPGRAAPLIAGERVIVHLPPDLISEPGIPRVVHSGAELLDQQDAAIPSWIKVGFPGRPGPSNGPPPSCSP